MSHYVNATASHYPTLTDTQCEVQLPTELASLFINGDWSIVDYIDDEYESIINATSKSWS